MMTNKEMDELIKEKEKLLNNKLIKGAEIGSYWDFIEEFINPYLPDDQKIAKGQSWTNTPLCDDLPDINFDDPFGIIVKF